MTPHLTLHSRLVIALGAGLAGSFALACSAAGSDAPSTLSDQSNGASDGTDTNIEGADIPEDSTLLLDPNPASEQPMEGCVVESVVTDPTPVDLMVLLDQSGSMTLDQPNRWEPVTAAIKAFVTEPTFSAMSVGLQYFPLGAATTEDPAICEPTNYESPDVPFGQLPGHAQSIVASIDAHHFTAAEGRDAPHWGTPTRPAVEGTLAYVQAWANSRPGRVPILLLATDGKPSKLCFESNDGIGEIGDVIAAAASVVPSIKTYVVGIGEVERLNEWADAGGTGSDAFIVDAAGGEVTQNEFIAALNEIRNLSLPCGYTIPEPSEGTIDFGRVNVVHTSDAGEVTRFVNVAGQAECQTGAEWYYDDPETPSQVVLCPGACTAFAGRTGELEIVFGCNIVIR